MGPAEGIIDDAYVLLLFLQGGSEIYWRCFQT